MWSILGLALLAVGCSPNSGLEPRACQVVQMVGPTQPFQPAQVTLRKGGCIEFVNADQGPHDAVSAPGTSSALQFGTRRLAPGERQKVVFNLAGEIEYICSVDGHAQLGMRGKIIVQP
ncbi:MAG: plastocyanin/azurin family copper-binding protein [Acidobacteriota bacterium]|nr:plastocyanin/azurin family copper-binding protein [Acidobacteriota bacterium]